MITVNDPGLVDFGTTPSFNLQVKATDSGSPSLSGTGSITIQLVNKNEPKLANQTVSLPELATVGTVVTTLSTTGGVSPFKYSILSVSSDSLSNANPSNLFTVDPNTGAITVKTAGFNYKDTKTYQLKVLVTDGQTPSLGDTATITVQITHLNVAPVLSGLETSPIAYTEKSTATVTSTIVASDIDSNNANQAVIKISNNYVNGQDQLLFTNTASITGSWKRRGGNTDTFGHRELERLPGGHSIGHLQEPVFESKHAATNDQLYDS